MTRTQEEAARAVAAVLDGARELAERHGVVLAASAAATYGDGEHEEMEIVAVGAPVKVLDLAATLTGALMPEGKGGLDMPTFRRAVLWGIENAVELTRGKKVA